MKKNFKLLLLDKSRRQEGEAYIKEFLKEHNITTVVNCAIGCTSNYKDLKFLELQLNDEELQNLEKDEHTYNADIYAQ